MTSAERRQSSGLTMESLSRSLNDVLRSAPLGIFRAHLVHANIWTSRTNTDYNLSFGVTASLTMSNDENNLGNVIGGTFFGALAGGGLGLGACMFLFDDPPFFTGDTILIGAIACGVLGYFLGAGFIEWLKENWWGFWS